MASRKGRVKPVEEAISPHSDWAQTPDRRGPGVNPGSAGNPRVIRPAVPGIPAPQIQPYMTPQDQMQYIDRESAYRQALADIDFQLSNLRAQHQYETGQIDKAATYNKRDMNDVMAARGMSQSSIKDAEIFDIEATARTRKEFLNSQLGLAEMKGYQDKLRLQDDWSRFVNAMNQQMVANADEANRRQGQWLQAPQAAVLAPHKKVVKNGKFYHVYGDGSKASDWVYIRPASTARR